MNKIILSIFSLFIFLGFANFSFAYDMEVQCSDTKCAVSSNAPVFSPGVYWIPNESVEKSIVLKNTSGGTKSIFLKTLSEGKPRELDEFINMSLFKQGSSDVIWSGSLSDLINEDEITIANLSANEEFELIITAKMDSLTPNGAQGNSSVFDFGFGFEGDSSSGSDNNANGNTNNGSSSNNNSGNNTSGSGGGTGSENEPQNILGQILEGVSTAFFGNTPSSVAQEQDENEGQVIGERDTNDTKSEVMGISDGCRSDFWWISILVLQALLSLLYVIKKINRKISVSLNGLGFMGASVYIYLTLCYLWPILISLGIFMLPILFAKRGFIKRKLSFK